MTNGADSNGLPDSIEGQPSLTAKGFLEAKPNTVTPSNLSWNTQDLSWRVASDVTAAGCAAGSVAPLIAIIDRGIIENASGRSPLRTSIATSFRTLFTRPHIFLLSRPFRIIATVYFSTYAMANTIDTVSSTIHSTHPQTTTAGPAKFFATSSVNMSLSLYKDSQFAKMFGPPGGSAIKRAIPKASYALFAFRDSLTIFASFNLPPLVAPRLPEEVEKVMGRASLAQLLAPAAVQVISTPLHLWGLDLYNRPTAKWGERVRKMGKDWAGSTAARMGRIVPAFGFGGVINAKVRRKLMGRLDSGIDE